MRHLPPTLAVLCVLAVLGLGPGAADAATVVPPMPRGMPTTIEPLAGYVAADSCDPVLRPGVERFAALLRRTWPGTTTGVTRACGADPLPTSEHYDGRAVDWMVGTGRAGRARARGLVHWLFAPDEAGNRYAMARRLGVMYVIWHNRIWGAYSAAEGWRPYSSCARHPGRSWDTTCHRDHVHVSFSWSGATGRTSFFTRSVSPVTDFGPCRVPGLNWAPRWRAPNPVPCPRLPQVRAARGAPAYVTALVTWSGMTLHRGMTGPAVAALDSALGVPGTSYDARTRDAVLDLQRRHGIRASGVMTIATWLALLPTLPGAPSLPLPPTVVDVTGQASGQAGGQAGG
ncbi:MAG: peptidoglycan-binding domain-containing protein [Marmoricola sp.]